MKIWVYREYSDGTLLDRIASTVLGFRYRADTAPYPQGYRDPTGWGYTRNQAIRRLEKAMAKKPRVERELLEIIEDCLEE